MTKAQEVVILPVMSRFCNSNFITCHHPLNLELTIFWLPQIIYQYIKVCMVNQFLKVLNCKTLNFFFFVVILVQIQLLVNMEVEYSAQQISNRQEPILIQFSITQAHKFGIQHKQMWQMLYTLNLSGLSFLKEIN